jgi:tRNA threonylcarbamoyladenosine biosynthesis protein TsaB
VTTNTEAAHQPTLVVEASTARGSVALVRGSEVLAAEAVGVRGDSAEGLMPAVARLLSATHVALADLDRVVCGAGPGGFTSLRMAAAIAKGLVSVGVMANRRPLAAVSSPLLIVAAAADRLAPGLYVTSVDALRGERYAALIELLPADRAPDGPGAVRLIEPWRRLPAAAVEAWAQVVEGTVIGPGCATDVWPEAWSVTRIWSEVREVDPVSWEPDYGRLAEAQVRRERAGAPERAP